MHSKNSQQYGNLHDFSWCAGKQYHIQLWKSAMSAENARNLNTNIHIHNKTNKKNLHFISNVYMVS